MVEALHAQGLDWCGDLRRCLRMGLLWRLAPWLREHPRAAAAARIEFFERLRPELSPLLLRHITALKEHLRRAPVEYATVKRSPTRSST